MTVLSCLAKWQPGKIEAVVISVAKKVEILGLGDDPRLEKMRTNSQLVSFFVNLRK